MKINNIEIEVGDMVLVTEKYNREYHYLKHDREYIGIVSQLIQDNIDKFIFIGTKRLVSPKLLTMKRIRDLHKLFYCIGIANFGLGSQKSFMIKDIKSIRVLK